MVRKISSSGRKQKAVSLVEYGLILGLIVIVCVTMLDLMGQEVKTFFTNFTDKVENANQRSNAAW